MKTATLVKIGMLSAAAFLLSFWKIALPVFPSFLTLEFSDLPALLAAIAIGPLAGLLVELIKNIIDLIVKPVGGGIGQLANFIVGTAYVLPLGFIVRRNKKVNGFITGAIAGTVAMAIVASLLNYFFLIPAYSVIMGIPIDGFVKMTGEVNKLVTDFKGLIVFAILPFNILKAVIISVIGFLMYPPLRPVLGKL